MREDSVDCDGACFDRSVLPAIFRDPTGWGPMRVAWDTNILIDFATYLAVFPDGPFEPPAGLAENKTEELLALETFIEIWARRDIRLYLSGVQLHDGVLTAERRASRENQLEQVAAAVECLHLEEFGRMHDFGPTRPDLPADLDPLDAHVVSEALRLSCDVLLTRDRKVVQRAETIARLGLQVMRPTQWLDAMAEADQLGLPGCIHGFWLPDSHKWGHLEAARAAAAP